MDFRILGPLEVDQEGRALPLEGRQQRALLALLLLHANEVVPVDGLIDELWPEAPPPSATRSVHALVSRLRRLLEDKPAAPNENEGDNGVLLTRSHGYLLRVAPGELDLHRFESLLQNGREALAAGQADVAAQALREALALWRGPPLAEFAHDSFAAVEIARLNELRLAALEERIEADLAAGRSTELIAELEALVASHPLRERLRGQLMLALYRAGRQAEALQVYQNTRRLLVGELGIEPGQTLQHLEQAILRHDKSLEPSTRPTAAEASARGAPRPIRLRIAQRGPWFLVPAAGIIGAAAILSALILRGGEAAPVEVHPNSLVVVDASTGHLVADLSTGGVPVAVAAGEGGFWAANREGPTVARSDEHAESVLKTIPLDATPSSIAAGDGAVWLTTLRGKLIRIDPEFGVETATLDPLPSQFGVNAVAAGGAGVWVLGRIGAARISPASNHVTIVVEDAAGARAAIAVGANSVWAAVEAAFDESSHAGAGTLYKISGRDVVATTALSKRPLGLTVGRDKVWIVLQEGALIAVDSDTAAIVGNVDVGGRATAVAVAGENVWVTSDDGTLRRVDAARLLVTKTIPLGRPAVAIAAAGDRLWVAVN